MRHSRTTEGNVSVWWGGHGDEFLSAEVAQILELAGADVNQS
jgi:hypothetical protein